MYIDGINYEVIINKKAIKHTYIRISDDLKIIISTSKTNNKTQLKEILEKNIKSIKRMLKKTKKKSLTENYILGQQVDIVVISNLKKPELNKNKLYLKNKDKLEEAKKIIAKEIFKERLNYLWSLFEENVPYPFLKIRKMKTRWGVCNPQKQTITLNLELLKKEIKDIDYVIVHELAHFIHANHGQEFWNLVAKYINNYQEIRKELRD